MHLKAELVSTTQILDTSSTQIPNVFTWKLRLDSDLMQLEPVQKERSDSFDAGVADPAHVLVV